MGVIVRMMGFFGRSDLKNGGDLLVVLILRIVGIFGRIDFQNGGDFW